MKNSNSFNNILSFLITSILIFMMMFFFISFAHSTYKRLNEQVEEIKEIREEIDQQIEDLMNIINNND
jgi:predicted PurR-regulated permease PerM